MKEEQLTCRNCFAESNGCSCCFRLFVYMIEFQADNFVFAAVLFHRCFLAAASFMTKTRQCNFL